MVRNILKAGVAFFAVVLVFLPANAARSHHYAFNSDEPEGYQSAIKKYRAFHPSAQDLGEGRSIRVGIVTHHFLASNLMAEFFECLSSGAKPPSRIILIGPDHYGKSRSRIAVSSLPWVTPFGEMRPDAKAAEEVSRELGLPEDEEAFSGEHSIGALVPFIRYYFPDSALVPIIIQKNVSAEVLPVLKRFIEKSLNDPKTLVLLSMDFVHNQTSAEADRRDELSKDVIEHLSADRTDELDVDCHPGLKILLASLRDRGNIRAKFLNHSNSAKITGQTNLTNVTSYYTILFYEYNQGGTGGNALSK